MKASFWTRVLDLVVPRTCSICGARLSATEQAVCAVCHLHLPLTHLEDAPYDNEMARLFWGIFPIERATALFYYEPKSETDELIYDLKYRGHALVGQELGQMAARRLQAAGFFDGIDAIVPVPLTRRRQWQRGYNQSEEIARGVSACTGLPVFAKVLRRTHFSESQTKKNAWERQANVETAFRLKDARSVACKHLLIVDDIVTTGATVKACAKELTKAPDVKISVMAIGLTRS